MRMSQSAISFLVVICLTLVVEHLAIKYLRFAPAQSVINFVDFEGKNRTTVIPDNLTDKQALLLDKAHKIAERDGHKNPEVLQGILLQETHAGNLKSYKVAGHELGLKTNLRYYGIAQMKLAAARDVLKAYPELNVQFGIQTNTDEEIIANLILNDDFAISLASKYLIILDQRYKIKNGNSVIAAYNQGPGGYRKIANVETFYYVESVRKHIAKHIVKTM